jgi:Ser/Thr protein kinase RdoA (MazF antagonist)
MPVQPSSKPLIATYSTIGGTALRDFIASEYAFEMPFECNLLRRGFNDVYTLRFADGRRSIARISSRRARGHSNVDFETALLAHLKAMGAHVASPLPTRTGALSTELEAIEGRRSLVLFEFLAGDFPRVDLQNIKAMAASLATLHRLAQSYSGPPSEYTLDLQHLIRRPLQRILSHPTTTEPLAERLETVAANLIAKIEAAAPLTHVVCHGDCHGGNTVITESSDGKRIASFFDFDDAGPGFLAYDLSVYLWAKLMHNQEPTLNDGQRERWKSFIEGYRESAAIPSNDFAAIALFVSARNFWLLGEYASRLDEWGSEALPLEWLQKQVEKLEQWQTLETPES